MKGKGAIAFFLCAVLTLLAGCHGNFRDRYSALRTDLEIARERGMPALMLTAHAVSKENLKKSFEKGAAYYVPKDEISKIDVFVADVLEAIENNRNVWVKWYERLSAFCDKRFGPNWKDDDPEFWESLIKY